MRAAKPKERITLLDDKEYELDPEFLVIADASGAIGLAGIMGGRAHRDFRFDHRCAAGVGAFHAGRDRGARAALRTVHRCRAALRARRGSRPCRRVAIERATALLMDIAGGEPGPVQVTARSLGAAPEAGPTVGELRRDRVTRLARRAGSR